MWLKPNNAESLIPAIKQFLKEKIIANKCSFRLIITKNQVLKL